MSVKANYHQLYYYRNKENRKAQIVLRQKNIKSKIQTIKLERGCHLCGYNKSAYALHFHHKDDNKENHICVMTAQRLFC